MKTYNQPQTDTMQVSLRTNVCSTHGGNQGEGAPARVTRARDLNV